MLSLLPKVCRMFSPLFLAQLLAIAVFLGRAGRWDMFPGMPLALDPWPMTTLFDLQVTEFPILLACSRTHFRK